MPFIIATLGTAFGTMVHVLVGPIPSHDPGCASAFSNTNMAHVAIKEGVVDNITTNVQVRRDGVQAA